MKKTNITLSIALAAVFSSSVAFAEAEVTGKIVHESAKFTNSGTTIGAASSHGKDVMKTETSARIYIDGEVNDATTYHVELNVMTDSKGIGKYDGNEADTQRDAIREAYIDTVATFGSIELSAQFVNTDFDENKEDSKIYGIKASTKLANIEITVAAAEVKDVLGTSVGADSIYTSMWNSFASDQSIGKSSLISLSTKIAGLSLTTAYANYEGIDNYEGNVIAEYSLSDTLGLTGVYTDTDKEEALEVMATYSF